MVLQESIGWIDEVEATGVLGSRFSNLNINDLALVPIIWSSDGSIGPLLRLDIDDVVHADGPVG